MSTSFIRKKRILFLCFIFDSSLSSAFESELFLWNSYCKRQTLYETSVTDTFWQLKHADNTVLFKIQDCCIANR
jgi:hypothetical protein